MRVLISGYYGFNNGGDDALLSGMLQSLRRAGPVDATVLSNDPAATERLHDVRSVQRHAYSAIWNRLKRETDLFISGGGGLLQDRTSRRSPLYYLGLVGMAQRAHVPTYLYAQGVGPIDSRAVRAVARRILPRIGGAGARDPVSARLLVDLGVDEQAVHRTADAAFSLMPSDRVSRQHVLQTYGIPAGEQPLIGVIWRSPLVARRGHISADDRNEGSEAREIGDVTRSVAEGIAKFAKAIGGRVVVMALYPEQDEGQVRLLTQALVEAGCPEVNPVWDWPDFKTMRALVEAMDINVSVRYHGVLFSALGGVPSVALIYDPKVRHLSSQLGMPGLDFPVDEQVLLGTLRSLWQEADAVGNRLNATVGELRKRALAEGERALRFARGR